MTPEAQRIAIAEACGWTSKTRSNIYEGKYAVWLKNGKLSPTKPPDYLNDLNAMREVEKTMDRESLDLYVDQLLSLIHEVDTGYFNRINWGHAVELLTATAAQRAEAFLKTIGKWQD